MEKIHLLKMRNEHQDIVQYYLPTPDGELNLNEFLGKELHFKFTGQINCIACGASTRKSYSQGHCWDCAQSLARNDLCIMKPETCHYHLGTCREPEWGESHCLKKHIVYLANSSGLKVGITRETNMPFRWMDQGATQALPIGWVSNRLASGLVEMSYKTQLNDKTSWQKMLKGEAEPVNLAEIAEYHRELWPSEAEGELFHEWKPLEFKYPILEYPTKVKSHNFDKNPDVGGTLMGIKAQYLIFDTGVINVRKFQGYWVELLL